MSTVALEGWPSPTRRGVRHSSRIPGSTARAEIYGLMVPAAGIGAIGLGWSLVGTGGWSTPDKIRAIVSLVSNPLDATVDTTLPVRAQITFTRHYLSLSVADFARLVGVERPAVYAWMDGDNEPRPANHSSLNRLHRAALCVKNRLGEPIGSLLRVTTPAVERTLYDLLSSAAEQPSVDATIDALATVGRQPMPTRSLPQRTEESVMRGRVRASSIAGRRLK